MKDIGFSFSPFMPILGTGLVTADGELWRTQRLLLGPALRTEMLDEVRRFGGGSAGAAMDCGTSHASHIVDEAVSNMQLAACCRRSGMKIRDASVK